MIVLAAGQTKAIAGTVLKDSYDWAGEAGKAHISVDMDNSRTFFFSWQTPDWWAEVWEEEAADSAGVNDLAKKCLIETLYECCVWVVWFH